MAKVNNLKRINTSDFPDKYQDLIGSLSFSLNPLLEQVTNAFNKGIDYDNLNRELITVDVTVNGSGVPTTSLEIRTSLKTRLKGSVIISAINLTDSTLLTGAPFLNYDLTTNGVVVKQITGLAANKKYSLNIEFIG